MKLDFNAIIRDEATNVPKEMEPFLRQAGRWDCENQTWARYNHAYDRAFTIMAEQCLNGKPGSANLVIPLFYLARHSMELALKEALHECHRGSSEDFKIQGHNLLKLFDQMEKYLVDNGFIAADEWSTYCRKLLMHINEVDPNGEAFRYPASKDGTPFQPSDVEIEGLIRAHHNVTLLADCTIQMLDDGRDCEYGGC